MKYGYINVMLTAPDVEKQLKAMYEMGLSRHQIFIDWQWNKSPERLNYKFLIAKLKKDDTLFIKSLDSLGGTVYTIFKEWRNITKTLKADIVVLDMPLLDTRIPLLHFSGNFLNDVVLGLLSFVVEKEQKIIRERQKEGLQKAKEHGVHLGRPTFTLPHNFANVLSIYENKEITSNEAIKMLGMKRGTFFKYLKKMRQSINDNETSLNN